MNFGPEPGDVVDGYEILGWEMLEDRYRLLSPSGHTVVMNGEQVAKMTPETVE